MLELNEKVQFSSKVRFLANFELNGVRFLPKNLNWTKVRFFLMNSNWTDHKFSVHLLLKSAAYGVVLLSKNKKIYAHEFFFSSFLAELWLYNKFPAKKNAKVFSFEIFHAHEIFFISFLAKLWPFCERKTNGSSVRELNLVRFANKELELNKVRFLVRWTRTGTSSI